MDEKFMKRRDFIKKCATSTAALGMLSCRNLLAKKSGVQYDAKGVPTRILGQTGVSVPLMVIGGGSRFCAVKDPKESAEILNYAIDHGFYYLDTAHDYEYEGVISEERYGVVVKDRREEIFLATKVQKRTYDDAMRDIEDSLRRLQTDRLDLLQIHNIQMLDDVEKIGSKDSVLRALYRMKDEKVTRFIGYSGHLSAESMAAMAERYDFDTMLIALNHYEERKGDFEKQAIPSAADKGMGILAMKVIRPREAVQGVNPEELIRYALSLPHVHAAVIGTDSLDVLKKNIALARNFQPMTQNAMKEMRSVLAPFFAGRHLPWMSPGYTDGISA
ncbi:MAG: aldo/keto reductase [Candidatus Aminicenantes bacterium]|jgi:aryl-alcohol dehydrogenase-like predicted oxidoreductase